jgi:hypothetical protein
VLTRGACQNILEFVERNGHVVEYFQNVFASDEAFFQTIVGNSCFKSRIRRNLHYYDWSSGPHPATINDQHIAWFEGQDKVFVNDAFGEGEVLFARKFSDNLELLQRMDDMIEEKERFPQK